MSLILFYMFLAFKLKKVIAHEQTLWLISLGPFNNSAVCILLLLWFLPIFKMREPKHTEAIYKVKGNSTHSSYNLKYPVVFSVWYYLLSLMQRKKHLVALIISYPKKLIHMLLNHLKSINQSISFSQAYLLIWFGSDRM